MNNSDVHNHLSDKEIRDFLGKQLQQCFLGQAGNTTEWLEKEIARLQKRLEVTRQYIALQKLVKNHGWQDFDISDEIPYDRETYFNFIGTVDEYEELLKQLDKE